MGGKESRPLSISYEDATKRVSESELRRLREAFKRTSANGVISCNTFIQDVLGDCVPTQVAEYIYAAFGGTQRGLSFKELLSGLVLLTRGKQDEKLRFLYDLYANGSVSQLAKDELTGDEGYEKVVKGATYEEWRDWQLQNVEASPLSRWLLTTSGALTLGNDLETPTFYQSLAGVTHLEEADIIELEKHYWTLKGQSGTGRLDLETLVPMISPPMPLSVCPGLVAAFDENRDNHIDFKEMACGISAACRGPLVERMKFCFKVFDGDRDGVLNEVELKHMLEVLMLVRDDEIEEGVEAKEEKKDLPNYPLSMEEWLVWTAEKELPLAFLRLLDQLCHVVLGLRPLGRSEEGEIVTGWLAREERRGLRVGQFWYLVAAQWWSQWRRYCLLDGLTSESNTTVSDSTAPGPIDNSNLVETVKQKVPALTGEGGRLRRTLVMTEGRDFHLLPDALWKALVQWHGGAPALPRQVILPATGVDVELELYPLVLRLLMHRSLGVQQQPLPLPLNGVGSWLPSSSSSGCYKRQLMYIAAFSRMATAGQVYQFLCNRLRLIGEDVRLWHVRDIGASGGGMTLLEDEHATLEELGLQDDSQLLIEVRNKDQTWPEELGRLRDSTKDDVSKGAGEKGATGLNNLGNTCFMNAALQCASNTGPLTRYFMSASHLRELNTTNPLGTRGHMAVRYAELLRDIWSGSARSVAPLKLRWTIAKYAPRFGGFQQHDSQELLAFLLDGLHEDLNRVRDAPYVELADSEGREDAQVAQEAWDNHLLRNQSIIVDLFHGQLKSTVRCEHCQWESVRFDPFTYLTLPLPMEGLIRREPLVARLDGGVPIRYGLLLPTDADYSALKTELSKLCDVPASRLLLAEVAANNIERFPSDRSTVQEAKAGTRLYAYEVPASHYPPSRNQQRSMTEASEERRSFKAIQMSETPPPPPPLPVSTEIKEYNNYGSDSSSNNSLSHGNGYVIALHRKMIRQDLYFASSQKTRPSLFGVPVVVSCGDGTTHQELYRSVWRQVARLVTPLPPTETAASPNHAQDCDDSLGYEFPFVLRAVDRDGRVCAWCPWYKFCRGCRIRCDGELMTAESMGSGLPVTHLAIDWDPTALHLRYQTATELSCDEHESAPQARIIESAPLPLSSCLAAFTRQESLERYHCQRCAEPRSATKRLQLWRLPPVLVVHLKRFHCVRGKWVKSQKAVRFPLKDFDPSEYLADPEHHHRLNHHRLHPSVNPEDVKYNLYAVVCHSGIMGGGHYVSYARNPDGGQWYYYNDSSCRESSPEAVANETATTAYILFYQRNGLSEEKYLPSISPEQERDSPTPNLEFSDPDENELRKMCTIT
ncbi:ubiquitin carboxyl-terminal hydrolase 32 [Neodiprion fabricii]|uniref:ubiquitin carboxyl-terminal hydrolase 32 n=1 Tax=Neodiprion fabricii TaxID=2872261 RepID=UPI001ED92078|nr:ubiquitin carboxyl-terminal hydrolase 32 [Neodiprion fabricii]